jgi:hypothetical protein
MDPGSWLRLLSAERATITGAPQFGFTLASRVPYPEDMDLSRVDIMLNGGERLSWEGLEDFHKAASRYGLAWESLLPVSGVRPGGEHRGDHMHTDLRDRSGPWPRRDGLLRRPTARGAAALCRDSAGPGRDPD